MIYQMINWFFGFSVLGYIWECLFLTYETKKPVLDRGFVHGPFCIIYGFGAVGAMLFLRPISHNFFLLFFGSMFMATTIEIITARVMVRVFGSVWWDYSKKPFNYKGIICLESSIGWGLLGVIFFRYLNGVMFQTVGRIPRTWQPKVAILLISYYVLDFLYTIMKEKRNPPDGENPEVGRLKIS